MSPAIVYTCDTVGLYLCHVYSLGREVDDMSKCHNMIVYIRTDRRENKKVLTTEYRIYKVKLNLKLKLNKITLSNAYTYSCYTTKCL